MNIALYWFGFVGLVILVGLALTLTQRRTPRNPQGDSWGLGTRFFLVTLRLAIGWHILFEGLEKFHSPTWSSEAYLREASGPLAETFRDLAGDGLLARLTPGDGKTFPEALDRDWQAYFTSFQRHYDLDEQQTAKARTIFEQARSTTLTWLLSGKKNVKLSSPYPPPVEVEKSVAARIQDYQDYENKVREIEEDELPVYGSVVYAKLLDAKKEANNIRAGLKGDLAKQTADMRAKLREKGKVLTPEQQDMPPPPDTVKLPITEWGQLEWANAAVTYGLLAVGVCLLLGVLTRAACLGGAMFLLLFYLAIPPLPDWPASPRLEGFYFYINKTLIEMLALLALATTSSGRWCGLDGLLRFLRPSAWRSDVPGVKLPRMRILWGVFNKSNECIATYEYARRKEADAHAAKLTSDKKNTHFVQPVKEPVELNEDERMMV